MRSNQFKLIQRNNDFRVLGTNYQTAKDKKKKKKKKETKPFFLKYSVVAFAARGGGWGWWNVTLMVIYHLAIYLKWRELHQHLQLNSSIPHISWD